MKISFIKIILNDPKRKNIIRIFFEFSRFFFTNRTIANQYFSKFLYHKGVKNFSDYVLTRKRQSLCWNLNSNIDYVSIFENKQVFEFFFNSKNIDVIPSFAYNINSLFFYGNKITQINSLEDFSDCLRRIFIENSIEALFIKKKEGSSGGKNIFKLFYHELESNTQKLNFIFKEVLKSGYLFQKVLVQHDKLNSLNPCSINSIRINTFTNKMNSTRVLFAIMRLGINRSIVDNVSSGGIIVGINIEEGKLLTEAITDFTHGNGRNFNEHPDTKIKFKDFQIPFFNEAKELVIKAAMFVPQVKLIGWDVAIQPKGPVLIEGNIHPGLRHSETVIKGFKNNFFVREMLKEANVTI